MSRLRAILLMSVVCILATTIGYAAVSPAAGTVAAAGQIVPQTKKYSKKVYRKGRWVTQTTWHHGKKITKKVWKKGNYYGHKTAHKTHDIIMGPKKQTP